MGRSAALGLKAICRVQNAQQAVAAEIREFREMADHGVTAGQEGREGEMEWSPPAEGCAKRRLELAVDAGENGIHQGNALVDL
jgi:hypothetical protein